jgi:hypothetical protein
MQLSDMPTVAFSCSPLRAKHSWLSRWSSSGCEVIILGESRGSLIPESSALAQRSSSFRHFVQRIPNGEYAERLHSYRDY